MDYAIIVAGGTGQRMGTKVPKQFLPLKGRPVLLRTIDCFYHYSRSVKIILGLPEEHIAGWEKICHDFNHPGHEIIVKGGATRFQTVYSCLKMINETSGCVAIHDGVRPLVSTDTIKRSFGPARKGRGGIPVLPVKESMRKLTSEGPIAVNRSDYFFVQTPQTFPIEKIKDAYSMITEEEFMTDDATVFEMAGHQIELVEGNGRNIKLTTSEDLEIATYFMHDL